MSTTLNKGRPKLPEGQRKVQTGVSLHPADLAKIDLIAEKLSMSRSGVVSMLLKERLAKWNGIRVGWGNPDDYDGA